MRDDLLRRARASLGGGRGVRLVFLRRAVSDAYYALFHALATLCADSLVGVSKRDSDAWRRVYRGIEHGRAKDEFNRNDIRRIHRDIGRIAEAFVQLQEARHAADYDPTTILTRRSDAEALIGAAETAIADIDALPPDIALELAACLIVRRRT